MGAGLSTVEVTLDDLSGDPLPNLKWSYSIDSAPYVETVHTNPAPLQYGVTVPVNNGTYTTLDVEVTAYNASGFESDEVSVSLLP